MSTESYDVFVSYRRDGGSALAQVIRNALAARGYRVFLDVRELRSGRFDEALKRTIESTPDFILLLTPHALERCANADDWVLQEILHAFATNRNVVLLRTEDFTIPTPDQLPPPISHLSGHNCVTYVHEHSDAAIERVVQMLRSNTRLQRQRTLMKAAALVAALLSLGGGAWWWTTRPPPPPPTVVVNVPATAQDGKATVVVAPTESDESKFAGSWEMAPQTVDSITVKMTARIEKDMSYRGVCTIEETGNVVFDENRLCYYVPQGKPPRLVLGELRADSMRTINAIPPAFWGFVAAGTGAPPPIDPNGYIWKHHRYDKDGFDARWDTDLAVSGQTWKLNLFTNPTGPYRFVAECVDTGKYAAKDGKFKIISASGVLTQGTYQFLDRDSYVGTAEPTGKPVLWKRVHR